MKKLFGSLPLFLLTSCATIMHGTTQPMGISSHPSFANIWIDNQFVGKTPLLVDLKRNQNHLISIELPGFLPYEIVCTRQVSGWIVGNIVFGGVIGLCIDAVSGAMYRLTPEQVDAMLREQQHEIAYSKGGECSIAIVLKADPSWEKIGQLESGPCSLPKL